MKLWEAVLNLFFPPKCPVCARIQDSAGICAACDKALPWIEEKHVLRKGPGGLRCAAPLWYEDSAREMLLRFKFQGASSAANALGEIIARCAAEQFSGEFDTVTWVPVSRKRLRRRGYDQSRLLAEAACRCWDAQPVQMLRKIVDNPPQSKIKDASARRANVLGVYEAVDENRVTGKRILLIDDICTTGATLTECIRVLKDAGAAEVVCVVAALIREQKREKIE